MTHKTLEEFVAEFKAENPTLCTRCGWSSSAHGKYTFCPMGTSKPARHELLPKQRYSAQEELRATATTYDQRDILEISNGPKGECRVYFHNGSRVFSDFGDSGNAPCLRRREDAVVAQAEVSTTVLSSGMVRHIPLFFMDDGTVRWKL